MECDVCHATLRDTGPRFTGPAGVYCARCYEIATCDHHSGQRFQHYDEDGCGYYVWRCDQCGGTTIDDFS